MFRSIVDRRNIDRGSASFVVKDLQRRLEKLESAEKKSLLKTITTSASTSALFLGLIITLTQVYDVVFLKPEADRISRITQFNQAVGSAAKIRHELVQSQSQTTNSRQRLELVSYATPRILNEIATARAMLDGLSPEDIGIPQLIVLISESFTTNDIQSAKIFVDRAVAKKNVTDYLKSEAKRYEGKYHFFAGDMLAARKSFEQAVAHLGQSPKAAAARALVLSDAAASELALGDCKVAVEKLETAIVAIGAPAIMQMNRMEMKSTLSDNINQWSRCAVPPELAARLLP